MIHFWTSRLNEMKPLEKNARGITAWQENISFFNELSKFSQNYSTSFTVWPIWAQTLALALDIAELGGFLNFLPSHLQYHE